MAIHFFESSGATLTDAEQFLLCDAEGACSYIHREGDDEQWVVIDVLNPARRSISFHPIDRFLPWPKKEKRCDCMLAHDGQIHFVELKNRKDSAYSHQQQWVSHGFSQILSTMKVFLEQAESAQYSISTSYLANRQRFQRAYFDELLDFKIQSSDLLGGSGVSVKLASYQTRPIIIE